MGRRGVRRVVHPPHALPPPLSTHPSSRSPLPCKKADKVSSAPELQISRGNCDGQNISMTKCQQHRRSFPSSPRLSPHLLLFLILLLLLAALIAFRPRPFKARVCSNARSNWTRGEKREVEWRWSGGGVEVELRWGVTMGKEKEEERGKEEEESIQQNERI